MRPRAELYPGKGIMTSEREKEIRGYGITRQLVPYHVVAELLAELDRVRADRDGVQKQYWNKCSDDVQLREALNIADLKNTFLSSKLELAVEALEWYNRVLIWDDAHIAEKALSKIRGEK